jgi:DNA-binding GntR family transcriptional regulator
MAAENQPAAGAPTPLGVRRTVLREEVKNVLLERILSGHYAPGERLIEIRIAQELGVSQAPVREALRDLEQLGCVEYAPFRGSSVRALSVADLLDAFPVRSALEALACRLAAERITDAQLERLGALIEEMRATADDPRAESAADSEFHATIVEAAGNATLARQWSQLLPHARTFISMTLPASTRGSVAERHVPILDALRRRDPAAAAAAMEEHLADVAARLQANEKETP